MKRTLLVFVVIGLALLAAGAAVIWMRAPRPQAAMPDMPQQFQPDGMMSGVGRRRPGTEEKKPMLPVTAWGRYAKVLLSSSEFLFIN